MLLMHIDTLTGIKERILGSPLHLVVRIRLYHFVVSKSIEFKECYFLTDKAKRKEVWRYRPMECFFGSDHQPIILNTENEPRGLKRQRPWTPQYFKSVIYDAFELPCIFNFIVCTETKCLRLRTHFAKQLFHNVKLNQFRSYLRLYPFYQPHSERPYRQQMCNTKQLPYRQHYGMDGR